MKGLTPLQTIVIGCAVGIVSLATQSIGLTLQRRSHIEEDEKPPGIPRKPAYKRHMWQIGLLLFLLSNVIGSSVQITTLPLIILSPLQAVGLVFNSICSSLLLSEPFTTYAMLGTVLVAMGALMVAFFGVVPDPHHNLAELLILLHRKPFIIWMLFTFIIMTGILMLIQASKSWEANPKHPDRLQLLRGALYGVICGILSAHSLLMAKSAVEIFVRGFSDHWKDLRQYQSWVIVGCFLFFAITQLYFLNCGLHLCSTSVIYPLIFCIYNIITIMNGLIYFQQASNLSILHYFMVALGTLLILGGVVCLSWRLGLNDDLGLHQHLLRRMSNDTEQAQNSPNQDFAEGSNETSQSLFSVLTAQPKYTSFRNFAPLSSSTNNQHGGAPYDMANDSSKRYDELSRTFESSPMLANSTTSYHSFSSNHAEPTAEQSGAFTEPVSPFTAASKNKHRLKGMHSPYK